MDILHVSPCTFLLAMSNSLKGETMIIQNSLKLLEDISNVEGKINELESSLVCLDCGLEKEKLLKDLISAYVITNKI